MAHTFSRRLSILYRDLIRRTSTSICSLLALDANQVQNFVPETHNARAPIQKSSHASLEQLKSRPHPQRLSDIDFTLRYPYLAARHTIVLVHEFESIPQFQVHYWEGIVQALRNLGASVITARVAKTGSVAFRARQLHDFLEKTLPGQKINLIGHSMGGLDGRYLISNIKNKSYEVLSLTTVATPHRGSPFMDWCKEHLRIAKVLSEQQAPNHSPNQDWFGRLMRHLDTPAYAHLTTDYCINKFNPNTPDDPKVSYFSYNAYVDQMSIANILHFPWTVINERVGRNDGVVPLESGRWGRLVETAQANHFDLVARYRWIAALWKAISRVDSNLASPPPHGKLAKPQQFNNVDFYLRMSTFLHSQGF